MQYKTGFEMCAFAFLAVVLIHKACKKSLPSKKATFFSMLTVGVALSMILDILTSAMIMRPGAIPYALDMTVNSLFYYVQMTIPAFFGLYVMSSTGVLTRIKVKTALLYLVPVFIYDIMLVVNLFTPILFVFDEANGMAYSHGSAFATSYAFIAFYLVLALTVILTERANITKAEFVTLLSSISIIIIAMPVQYLLPNYLITGVAMALSVSALYFSIQNPDDLLDGTTSLYNQKALRIYLDEQCAYNVKYIIVDVALDNMVFINKTYGVGFGNELLSVVAKRLLQFVKNHGKVFRYGGDRFVIITTEHRCCLDALTAIENMFAHNIDVGGVSVDAKATVGYMADGTAGVPAGEIMSILDEAMQQAKRGGGGIQYRIDGDAVVRINKNIKIEKELEDALRSTGLEVYLQPLYSVKTGKLTGAEALSRFSGRTIGRVPPDEFIPLAERSGLIIKLGEFVLDSVCSFVRERGLDAPDSGIEQISINLSAIELMQSDICKKVAAILKKYSIRRGFIRFEITESVAQNVKQAIKNNMLEFVEMGIEFSLDDFGTGYANLDSIVNLPIDTR